MIGSWPHSASALALLWLAGCVDHEPGVTGTTSLQVSVVSPAQLGSESSRLPDSVREATLSITALDEQGNPDTGFSATVDVYTHFLGTLSPPSQQVTISGGTGAVKVTLPSFVLGPTYLWVEDIEGGAPTYATGTSPTFWFRDPFLADLSTPDMSQPTSSWILDSPLEGKQVTVTGSKHGAAGHLVATGVYTQGYTLSDVDCSTKPCTAEPYNHIFVFSFGRATDSVSGRAIQVGDHVAWVAGGVSEFNGFTEMGFPQTGLVVDDSGRPLAPDESLIPQPVKVDPVWLNTTGGLVHLEEVESALVEVDNGTVCPLDSDFESFSQWKLDVGYGCGMGAPFNVITAGQVSGIDPGALVGRTIPRVVGTLKAVNQNVWIVQPRRMSDITL